MNTSFLLINANPQQTKRKHETMKMDRALVVLNESMYESFDFVEWQDQRI